MVNPLAVFASVERLWPHDDADYSWFGMNLVTAVVGKFDDADLAWLEPWKWNRVKKVSLWFGGKDVDNKPVDELSDKAEVVPHPALVAGDERDAAVAALERRRAGLANPAAFLYDCTSSKWPRVRCPIREPRGG